MARSLIERSIYFEPLQVLYNVINSNVPDPNPERSTREKEAARRWIWPTTPETNDEDYPRIALIHGRPRIEEWTAGQFVEYQNFNTHVRAVNSNIAVIPVTIGIFVKKTIHKPFEVSDPDGTHRWVENSAQVAWLLDKVQREIHRARGVFIEKDMDIVILDMEGTYEDNDFLWAGDITAEIHIKNIWTEDINKLIETINLGLRVQLQDGSTVPAP